MEVKTSDLIGSALDWAVAKCECLPLRFDPMGFGKETPKSITAGWWVWTDGLAGLAMIIGHKKVTPNQHDGYSPSTDWAQGGPIIEREKIDIRNTITEGGYRTSDSMDACYAQITLPNGATVFDAEKVAFDYGPTPLIAAMRCYVASKLGDTVDVPDSLVV